jgi:circadian clock protein KaiC
MTNNTTINRLATGVPGLDEVLGGGLPEFSFNVIAGQPGCGKTTLAHQIMFSLATAERPALYFTILGEPSVKLLRYQMQFEFFDAGLVDRAIRFVDLSDEALDSDSAKVLQRIVDEVEAQRSGLVFVDSVRCMASSTIESNEHTGLRPFVQRLSMVLTRWHATTFLIGECVRKSDAQAMFTEADGLLWLRQSVLRNSMVRKLQVMKMRGQPTLPGLHTFRIGPAGIQVFAPALLLSAAQRAATTPKARSRVMVGVPGLDQMLGGGVPRGFSVLVAGPSGSGKSILCAAFLAEGARCGEKGVIASFEQQPSRSLNRVLTELIGSGQVGLVESRAPDLSIDEIVLLLINEIRRLKATRVVIDSLSGFELAVAPTFRGDFRESLARLVSALASEGVSVMLTSELEDRYIDLRFSPYGTAFLTDSIIVMRYVEVASRLLRVIAVVKVRASPHSDELREFTIDNDGIRVGEMLADQEGLLSGRPTRKRSPHQSESAAWRGDQSDS